MARITVTLSLDDYQWLTQQAKDDDRTASSIIRRALAEWRCRQNQAASS